ncbi:MAG: hypothetical protein QNJ03_09910, partial [Dinoroseobacter sp.]|nr:hypothetical protein [Dinoroseobacter sp.]
GAGDPVSLLESATDQVSYLRRKIHHAIAQLEQIAERDAFERISKTELQRQLKDLREVTMTVIREEARIAEECRKLSGELSSGTYDLDAARTEIRSRLARLREAGGDGGFPEGSE